MRIEAQAGLGESEIQGETPSGAKVLRWKGFQCVREKERPPPLPPHHRCWSTVGKRKTVGHEVLSHEKSWDFSSVKGKQITRALGRVTF